MIKKYRSLLALLGWLCGIGVANAQTTATENSKEEQFKDSTALNLLVDLGLRREKNWRNTAATFTLSGRELEKMFSGNLLNTLQGRIPGLTVNTGSGEPGYDNPNLFMRGRTTWNNGAAQQLILLDGFQVDLSALSAFSPYEIESITLLKDAAATAMFGLQGASGVISVATKKGKAATKNELTINARYGVQTPVNLPQAMNAYDYTRLYNQALANDGLPQKYPNPDLYKSANDPFHPNVNWYDELLKKNSTIQNYNLSFRGGNRSARYYVLMDYMNYDGLYKNATAINKDFGTNAKYSKINLRANVELDLTKSLYVAANVSGIIEDRNTPSGFTASQVFDNLMRIPAAAFPVKNPNGTWGNSSVYNFNPIQLLQQNGIYSAHTRTIQTNFKVREKLDLITPGLAAIGGMSFNNQYTGTRQTLYSVMSFEILKDNNDQPVLDGQGNPTYRTIGTNTPQTTNESGNGHWNRNTFQAGLDYNRSFGKSTWSGMLLGRRVNYTRIGQTYAVRVQGIAGNLTYDYDKRYILDFSSSYMGSADFAPGNKYGFFPALSAGWILSNEGFLAGSEVVNFLKLRGSYGSAGSINDAYRFLYQERAGGASGWITGTSNTGRGGMAVGAFDNPDATWELKKTLNIGVEATLWDKLSATIDVFKETRSGIYEIPYANVAAYTGFNLPYLNTGTVDNKGFETVLTYNNHSGEFKYFVSGTATFARNKIIEKSETAQPSDRLYESGFSIGQVKGLVFDGFYQSADFDGNGSLKQGIATSSYAQVKPGDLKFKDLDGNGVINEYDRAPWGYNNVPEVTLGFNLGFNYKGFDFSTFVQGVMNRTISMLGAAYNYTHPFVNNNNISAFSANAWTPETAATATAPRLSTLANLNNNVGADFWFRNGNFFKLRSIELGYTIPQMGALKKVGAIRVFVNGTNLWVSNKIDGLEPENLSMGYPVTKVVDFGFNVKF